MRRSHLKMEKNQLENIDVIVDLGLSSGQKLGNFWHQTRCFRKRGKLEVLTGSSALTQCKDNQAKESWAQIKGTPFLLHLFQRRNLHSSVISPWELSEWILFISFVTNLRTLKSTFPWLSQTCPNSSPGSPVSLNMLLSALVGTSQNLQKKSRFNLFLSKV